MANRFQHAPRDSSEFINRLSFAINNETKLCPRCSLLTRTNINVFQKTNRNFNRNVFTNESQTRRADNDSSAGARTYMKY